MSLHRTLPLAILLLACRSDDGGITKFNSTPEAQILSHQSGDSFFVGDVVEFVGKVTDANHDMDELTTVWVVDGDEVCGQTPPDEDGNSLCTIEMPSGASEVSLQVNDPEQAAGLDTITISVSDGEPPEITLTSPTDGDVYTEGESILFAATITDVDNPPEEITVSWASDLDGEFSTQGPDSADVAQFNLATLSAGTHNLTVTATDSRELYRSALATITINGVPTAPTVSIAPTPADTNDDLTATATDSTDPDGQTVTYQYEWLLNGSVTSTGAVLANSQTEKGQSWTVRATPSDGISDGAPGEASITISNAPPVVDTVSISPNAPSTQDTLTCAAVTSDADSDTVTVTYTWFVGQNAQTSTSNTLNGPFLNGDLVTCRVTPNDGEDDGDYGEASVTIVNSPPAIASVNLSPSVVTTDMDTTAQVSATDPEGDPITYTFNWMVNGVQVASNQTTAVNDSLDHSNYIKDDSITVEVIADDGSATDTMTSAALIVSNSAPSAFNPLIEPIEPAAGADDLICSAQTSDADGDSVSLTYEWTVDGVLTTHVTDTVPASETADGEIWVCTMTPDDGTDDGTPVSAQVEIGADAEGAVGMGWCASAGHVTNSSHELTFCLSPVGLAGGESSNATYTLQQGPMYKFRPE